MDASLNSLETKLAQLLELCRTLRVENQRLRQQMALATDHNKQLKERVAIASTRLEAVLSKIPEVD